SYRRGSHSADPRCRGQKARVAATLPDGHDRPNLDTSSRCHRSGDVMLRITGGKVYDPANGIDGVVKDISISDGRIVSEVEGARVIDARGMLVFPGGVDIHTHVAGAALNFARAMTPENQRQATAFLHSAQRRAGIGGPTPTTFATGYLYAGM